MKTKTSSLIFVGAIFFSLNAGFSRNLLKSGNLQGILVSKGEFWIEVKDDNGYAERYLAPWHGLGPSRGGGFDRASLSRFKELVVGNRVSMTWTWDGHLRAHEIGVILPGRESGMFEGYLLEIGDRWIDVQNADEKIPWRFYLPWVGGYPENGGDYDHRIIEPLREHQPTNPIIFEWKYQLRPRIVKLVTREEISFKPFYEMDNVPPWLGPPGQNKNMFNPKPVNPFDIIQGKSLNPFDSVTPKGQGINPFESSGSKPSPGNPFDSIPSSQNPFDRISPPRKSSSGNPFDSVNTKKKELNPFEGSAPSSNPFESVEP